MVNVLHNAPMVPIQKMLNVPYVMLHVLNVILLLPAKLVPKVIYLKKALKNVLWVVKRVNIWMMENVNHVIPLVQDVMIVLLVANVKKKVI